MARRFDVREHVAYLNTIRISLSRTYFTSATIREHFRNSGIPSNMLFWSIFSNSGLLKKVGKDQYCFESNLPIHFKTFAEIYNTYKSKANSYTTKWQNKKNRKQLLKRPDIQAAIKLLKANGMDVVVSIEKI